MCEKQVSVEVIVPADLSCTGQAERKMVQIDACIADLVKALQDAKIDTRECCCGHERTCGDITLEDGRVLLIIPADQAADWFCRSGIKWLAEEIKRRARELERRLAEWAAYAKKKERGSGKARA